MVNNKHLQEQISNHLSKYFKYSSKVKLPEYDFELLSISEGDVTITDPNSCPGNVTFSMLATVKKKDPVSNVMSTGNTRFVGVASVKEYEGNYASNADSRMLPLVTFIEVISIS